MSEFCGVWPNPGLNNPCTKEDNHDGKHKAADGFEWERPYNTSPGSPHVLGPLSVGGNVIQGVIAWAINEEIAIEVVRFANIGREYHPAQTPLETTVFEKYAQPGETLEDLVARVSNLALGEPCNDHANGAIAAPPSTENTATNATENSLPSPSPATSRKKNNRT